VTVSDIIDDTAAYLGEKVTVSGEVEDVRGPRTFLIGGDECVFDDELVVLTSIPYPAMKGRDADLAEDDIVQVTGTVRNFNVVDVEREIDWDLDPQLDVEMEGVKTGLVADSMLVTGRDD
jgi:hypothetical protein